MIHADVREQMELAALEPDGLDRLAAGDTPESVAVAGHLAGCPTCLEELGRLRRTAALLQGTLGAESAGEEGSVPALPPDLRERTLAFVRAVGVDRSEAAQRPSRVTALPPSPSTSESGGAAPAATSARLRLLRPATWFGSIAAAVAIAVIGTALVVGGGRPAASQDGVEDLARLATWSIDVERAADARQVALLGSAGGVTGGLLLFAPSTGHLVVSAHDLAPAPAGHEYRCWMETPGGRTAVGRMFFAGGIAYWVGQVDGLAAAGSGTHFGVTLVDLAAPFLDTEPALLGTL